MNLKLCSSACVNFLTRRLEKDEKLPRGSLVSLEDTFSRHVFKELFYDVANYVFIEMVRAFIPTAWEE